MKTKAQKGGGERAETEPRATEGGQESEGTRGEGDFNVGSTEVHWGAPF